ncbi:helix-turn-helix domain-containing protein [Sporosarcina sp. FSL K6-3457]|uniref:helix-turn-helix domain-containing protein n=1 Tax=Sporosarcina sp. FSL K6-3457 TaxID=2978204 RepID=UPI0030F5E205
MHIGTRLKELRNLKGMTQAAVSQGITSAPHYSNIEGGHFVTSQDILVLLAKRLSVPIGYLTHGHATDKKITVLLRQYEDLLNEDRLEEALSFREMHEKSFTYIYSLHQELYFRLLRSIEFFKGKNFEAFGQYYIDKIVPCIGQDTLFNLNTFIQEKYNYISGLYYYINANYQECIPLFVSVLKMNEDPLLHARLNFNIALAYFRLLHYNDALEFVKKAKDHHLNLHNWKSTADCYNLMGVLYKGQKDFINAEIYTLKGLHIIGDTDMVRQARLQHNLAIIYKEQKRLSEALDVINSSLALKKEHDSDDLFISYRGKLIILLELKDVKLLLKTIELARSTCITELDRVHLQVFEGKLFLLQNNYPKYEKYIQQSIDYYFKLERLDDLKDLAEELAEYYAERKQYKKAYELNKKCILALKNI